MNTIIFGPIHSRRFGKSLGVDLSPSKKQCNFDCLYCELEPAKTTATQDEVVPLDTIVQAVNDALARHNDIDVLTFTANGEPTLYPYLGELMDKIDTIKGDVKTLILSNASTIDDPKVQEALVKFDEVKLSLDCATQACLRKLDRSHRGIDVECIKEGMLAFKARYKGPLIIEILMVKGLNDSAEEIAALNEYLLKLQPTRIDIGTIDRPPAYAVRPLSYDELLRTARCFDASLPIYIASRTKGQVRPGRYDETAILETLSKRPLSDDDIKALFDETSRATLRRLCDESKVERVENNGVVFYKTASIT